MPLPHPLPTYLYKILPTAPPTPLPSTLPLSDLDRNDGFIHLSTAQQVPSTADKFFSDYQTLWLLKIRLEGLEAKSGEGAQIKWEEVGRGCFAHLYGGGLGEGNVDGVLEVGRGGGKWEEGEMGRLEA